MKMDVESLFRQYGPMVVRRCRQLLRDEDEALEVSQDVFVQLLRRRGNLRMRHPSSLLYRMATNLSLNRIRDRKRKPATGDEDLLCQLAAVEETENRLEARSILGRLFSRYPDSSRVMAVLHFIDGLTLEEVAARVGMSVPGVRKRLGALRQTLAEMGDR
jgi:RNA polymerase sigma-70 factor (ECF subfamily)